MIHHEWHTIICVWEQYIACYFSLYVCFVEMKKIPIQRAICDVNDNVLIGCLQDIGICYSYTN